MVCTGLMVYHRSLDMEPLFCSFDRYFHITQVIECIKDPDNIDTICNSFTNKGLDYIIGDNADNPQETVLSTTCCRLVCLTR